MSKKFCVNGKSLKRSEMTPTLLKREEVTQEERKATAEWYRRMSGQTPWSEGERESFRIRFDGFSREIDDLNRQIAAQEFAAMPLGF